MRRSVLPPRRCDVSYIPIFQSAEGEHEVFRRITDYGDFLRGLAFAVAGVRRDAENIKVRCSIGSSIG